MCGDGKEAYRPVDEEEVKPRTAEEIYRCKQEKMRGKRTSTGSDLMEDCIR